MHIQEFFDVDTATFTYVLSDPTQKVAAVIDSVLNYDPFSGKTSTTAADKVIAYLTQQQLKLVWILETHIHADHLTAAHYLKEKLGGQIGMGSGIRDVLKFWVPFFNLASDVPLDASQFDVLFEDNQSLPLGSLEIKVLHTPGHTPACATYQVQDALFVGDTLFMPDVGTARTDFPGGSAATLYESIQRLYALPDETRVYVGHDYPTAGREPQACTTIGDEKKANVLLPGNLAKEAYVQTRQARDHGKPVPKLLLPALQVNLRAGTFGAAESNGRHYLKIPVNAL